MSTDNQNHRYPTRNRGTAAAQAIGQQQESVESARESGRTTHGDIGSLEEELKALHPKGEASRG
ncbi:hypothetical protein H2248_002211 [Termitomyces sp. 'cryptogamus']|nr:hypothetical protein H2248_002211 [Termitomyces sp. 'cryptogamus']